MYKHMLIDARNAIYRAIYAGLGDKEFRNSNHDFAVIFFRFVSHYLTRFKVGSVHFFWDAPKKTVWRRGIASDYKEGRDGHSKARDYPDVDIDELLTRCSKICQELITACNCRNYQRERQEADDLIYAFCRQNVGDKTLIVSSDGDFKQIPYMFENVDLFNPMSKTGKVLAVEEVDPVQVKSFSGEAGDNIHGYPGIGPVRARNLVTDPESRRDFFTVHGRRKYLRNRALIDLSLCPFTLANINYIMKVMVKDTAYDEGKIREIIQKYKVIGLSGEISRSLLPFKFLQ